MAYIGSSASPLPVNFAAVQAQSFNGTGSQTAFTLSRTVPSAASIEVLVNNVQQSPYDGSYSVSGTTLTFSEAPSSGTNNVYVVYRDQALGSLVDAGAVRKAGDTMNGLATLAGGFYNSKFPIITSATTLDSSYLGGFVELSSNSFTLTLPDPTLYAGAEIIVWNNGPSCTIATPSGSFYGPFGNSSASIQIPNQVTYRLVSDAYNWIIVNSQSVGANSASAAAPVYGARAWVNFNGQGTVAIRGSGNVSSITDTGTGTYQVNFATAMPDVNYAATYGVDGSGVISGALIEFNSRATGYVSVRGLAANTNNYDFPMIAVAIHR